MTEMCISSPCSAGLPQGREPINAIRYSVSSSSRDKYCTSKACVYVGMAGPGDSTVRARIKKVQVPL